MTLMRYLQSHALKSEMFFNSLQKFKPKTKTKTKTKSNIIFFFLTDDKNIHAHTTLVFVEVGDQIHSF